MSYILYISFAYTFHFLLCFMLANTLEADTINNCMYQKVLSLYETVISICIYPKVSSLYETVTYACIMTQTRSYIPEGIITVRDSDLCLYYVTQIGLYIPEGIITVQDSDLCHVMIQTGSMSLTQMGPRYL